MLTVLAENIPKLQVNGDESRMSAVKEYVLNQRGPGKKVVYVNSPQEGNELADWMAGALS